MRRLAATIRCDLRLQRRNGFYYAAAFVCAASIAVLHIVPASLRALLLPVLVLTNVQVNTFYFIAGLLLLEKGEATLSALLVTPLRTGDYLASKVLTLTLLSLVENVTILLFSAPSPAALPSMIAGISLLSAFFSLAGFLAAVRYESLSAYLLSSLGYSALLFLPLLDYLHLLPGRIYILHPVQPLLRLLDSSAPHPSAGVRLFGLIFSLVWIVGLAALSCRQFRHFVVSAARPRKPGLLATRERT